MRCIGRKCQKTGAHRTDTGPGTLGNNELYSICCIFLVESNVSHPTHCNTCGRYGGVPQDRAASAFFWCFSTAKPPLPTQHPGHSPFCTPTDFFGRLACQALLQLSDL